MNCHILGVQYTSFSVNLQLQFFFPINKVKHLSSNITISDTTVTSGFCVLNIYYVVSLGSAVTYSVSTIHFVLNQLLYITLYRHNFKNKFVRKFCLFFLVLGTEPRAFALSYKPSLFNFVNLRQSLVKLPTPSKNYRLNSARITGMHQHAWLRKKFLM